ncbi:hypothetical protein [Catenuloplanes atrovinosus]|uniref:Adhesin domain-containing protein n=1 Tax=Catenuloplanes atrovinosus TaxID=137266 RepID=A0AAE4C830_9ACTN|nr:hypothetical protein [Catenuloplanes atrovinosus]MDR7274212.1 hypothetical protein [Catenuloplanes atrovinosus]
MTGTIGWRVIGSVWSALILLACTGVTAAVAAAQSSHTTTVHHGIRSLVVELDEGRLTVRRGGPDVRVHRHLSWSWFAPRVTERRDDSTLTLGAGCATRVSDRSDIVVAVNCSIDYEIEVPPDLTLTATTTSGIEVDGLTGAANLTCEEGDIVVTGAGGPVVARTYIGDVDVVFVRPPLTADLTTGEGNIRMLVPPGHDYRVSSSARHTASAVVSAPSAAHQLIARGDGTVSIGYTAGPG